jgi:tRNA-specific 2-thiouridylase
MKKALVLFSGGLDSILAVKVIREAGAAAEAVHFLNPFHQNRDYSLVEKAAAAVGVKLYLYQLTQDYLNLIAHPDHGYGKRMNPCIDCRIYQLKLAKAMMAADGASFMATGEVLDQRPNSQRRDALDIVEREAGVRGILLRPLSAQHLRPTLPELEGWVERGKLLDIKGRGRNRQLELAAQYGITDFPAPAGGCLLTNEEYSKKVSDLLTHGSGIDMRQIDLLRCGRHLRLSPQVKIIVGKDRRENEQLTEVATGEDYLLELPEYQGPVTLYLGPESGPELELAAAITAGYSKIPEGQATVQVTARRGGEVKRLSVKPLSRAEIRRFFVY